ncbi:phosphoribosyltransferase, partial [Marinitenerispora sediminis]
MLFTDRRDAGRRLAAEPGLRRITDAVVLGLPRGGVPVAFEVAAELGAPLDVAVVRKLGVPYQPELAMGAIGEGGVRVLDERTLLLAGLGEWDVAAVERHERAELEQRVRRLRALRPRVALAGRTAVVVDDGVATGSTARAACRIARAQGAARVVVAVPVGPPEAVARLREVADDVVCSEQPPF